MKIILSEKKCSGCLACKQICPAKAIDLETDERGFWNPKINEKACVNCKQCQGVCPCNTTSPNKEVNLIYGARHKDKKVLKESQSGGIFSGIASRILEEGGVCYGAAVGEDCQVRQIRIDSVNALHKLQGSKYIQSNVENTFIEVKDDLIKGMTVLYSGTSCMIAGLLSYLEKKKVNKDKLFTCDLICYGVPSPLFYNKNIERLEKEHQSAITKVKFRDKKYGWRGIMETYEFSSGKVISQKYYSELFALKVLLRDCCYECEYIDITKKKADITIGDFWGIRNYNAPFEDDNTGCSIVFIHSEKGKQLFKMGDFEYFPLDMDSALSGNRAHNEKKPYCFNSFWKRYKKKGYMHCLKYYTSYGGKLVKIRRKIYKLLNKWL